MTESSNECADVKRVEIVLPRSYVKIYRCLATMYWSILVIFLLNVFFIGVGVWFLYYLGFRKSVRVWLMEGTRGAVLFLHVVYYCLLGLLTWYAIDGIYPGIERAYWLKPDGQQSVRGCLFVALGIFYWVGLGGHVISFMRLDGMCPVCKKWPFGVIKQPCVKRCVCGAELVFVCRFFEAYSPLEPDQLEEIQDEPAKQDC